MIQQLRKQRLAWITGAYWFLLIYIIAALVWWFISLESQNQRMKVYRLAELHQDDTAYRQKQLMIEDEARRKTTQYIGEGITFFALIMLGAVFVYRAVRRQIKLSQQQNNFMMAVTHEFKTPIAVARLNLETLLKRQLDESRQQKLLQQALQETNRLNELTSNILIAAQLESGNFMLSRQHVGLDAIVARAGEEYAARFPQRSFRVQVDDAVTVEGEPMLLQLLVNNLLDNAVKYSPKDTPVTVGLTRSGNLAILTVQDEGSGIPDTEKKKIFQKFYRSGDENVRAAKGTGLGLYLCRRIVLDHKGTIQVEDNAPRGTKFTITLQIV